MDKINVLEYSQMSDVSMYDTILKHLKPKNKFKGKEVNIYSLSYGTVKTIQKLLSNIDTFEKVFLVFKKVFDVSKDEFYKSDIEEYYSARRYILDTFESINKKEIAMSQAANIDITKWEASGGKRLETFSTILGVDSICERYGVYPFEIIEKPYHEVFFLQSMVKELNEVNYNYSKP